ncbi:Dinitrogenase iron-molybdenum cofactor biosynthesis protein [Methanobacterium lacus]|uniref:Dinitrogenase iron-molybdenum cofactor biosynthesis protein n=1 Tax=Methanobacterium lacus (strain AL-21) TaxID=877455 RepID=F0T6W8_METLA|nr:NifB/NifX family molybdenum-iron cluster-binding protein [Methanobacterium lacus]ADZ09488.1 Dinitrogenase iron-molybdenum cofactor biosynthesis protein [Methanobacterium lacus]
MIICVPSMESTGLLSKISTHFGKTPYFTILDMENNEIKTLETKKIESRHAGGKKTPAEIIIEINPDVVLCANLGLKAVEMLKEHGIKIYVEASGTVENSLKAYLNNELKLADENTACSEGH